MLERAFGASLGTNLLRWIWTLRNCSRSETTVAEAAAGVIRAAFDAVKAIGFRAVPTVVVDLVGVRLVHVRGLGLEHVEAFCDAAPCQHFRCCRSWGRDRTRGSRTSE